MKKLCCIILALCLAAAWASAQEMPDPAIENTAAPATEATAEPAIEATPVPSAEPTPESNPEPLPEESPAPEAEATPEATPEATDAPSSEPPAAPSPEPSISPEEIEGWLLDAGGARLLAGRLEDLLQQGGALRIAISSGRAILLEDFPTARLRELEFLPDGEIFPGADWRVVCSKSARLRDEYSPEEIAAAPEDARAPLWIWVREELPAPEEPRLIVNAENLVPGQWSNIPPRFSMESTAPGECEYAVIILDERIAMLSGSSYQPQEEGVYTVRLALMDGMGDIVDRSEKFTLYLDWSLPELSIDVSMDEDRTMTIQATDRVSGVSGLSLDGGESWMKFGEAFTYTAPDKQSFAPGMILVRDNAGNTAANAEEIVLKKIPSMGGGGSGSSTVSKQHASGDGDTAEYASYALELPEGAVTDLTLGGEATGLRLLQDEKMLSFTAELAGWARESDGNAQPDTLILRACGEGEGEIAWQINGAVLRKLYNSDIAYLVLERGGEMLSLPTAGFTGGTRYAQLKMMGASTQEFEYEIAMARRTEAAQRGPGFNQSRYTEPSIRVEVAGERFEMGRRNETPEMYFYDVYCAPDDLTGYPYGAYPGTNEEREV